MNDRVPSCTKKCYAGCTNSYMHFASLSPHPLFSGGLGASPSDETINRGPVCSMHLAHVKEPTATKELSLANVQVVV